MLGWQAVESRGGAAIPRWLHHAALSRQRVILAVDDQLRKGSSGGRRGAAPDRPRRHRALNQSLCRMTCRALPFRGARQEDTEIDRGAFKHSAQLWQTIQSAIARRKHFGCCGALRRDYPHDTRPWCGPQPHPRGAQACHSRSLGGRLTVSQSSLAGGSGGAIARTRHLNESLVTVTFISARSNAHPSAF